MVIDRKSMQRRFAIKQKLVDALELALYHTEELYPHHRWMDVARKAIADAKGEEDGND